MSPQDTPLAYRAGMAPLPPSDEWRFVDLFAGCGGLTWGFVDEGFVPVGGVEMDRDAAATHAVNFGNSIHHGDIADWLEIGPPRAEIVIGGPPCQGFSALGSRDPDDPRNELWRRYFEVLLQVKPRYFVLENVPQFLDSKQFEMLRNLTRYGRLKHYELESFVLDASRYGVPQARRRAVVIGRPRGAAPLGRPVEIAGARTVREAFEPIDFGVAGTTLPDSRTQVLGMDVPGVFKMRDLHVTRKPTALSLERYRAIPEGGNRFSLPDRLKAPCWRKHTTGSGDVMGRLRWDQPSVTVRTEFYKPEKGRYLHPVLDRPITHLEAAALQTFPEAFLWCGTKVSIARQIGNAVPPLLAKAIARHIRQHAELD